MRARREVEQAMGEAERIAARDPRSGSSDEAEFKAWVEESDRADAAFEAARARLAALEQTPTPPRRPQSSPGSNPSAVSTARYQEETDDMVNATRSRQEGIALAEMTAAERTPFLDPDGDAARAQTESLLHDARARVAAGDDPMVRLDENGTSGG